MAQAEILIENLRGGHVEGVHRGHAIILNGAGEVIQSWGDPQAVIFPRSSCKMVQALPLIESGAADAFGLTSAHLALACASHQGADLHTDGVGAWLDGIGIDRAALICGAQMPRESSVKTHMIKTDTSPCPIHNNCSGKHAGFLTLAKHLGADFNYVDLDHPVQQAILAATEETADEAVQGHGIDGCSAPNFRLTLMGFGRQMAAFARAPQEVGSRARAMTRLVNAMRSHPEHVAGDGRACTELMHAMKGAGAVKTGAEGVFSAILPELDRAIVLKIEDGATRASEAAIAALLVRVGALQADDPMVVKRMLRPMPNFAGDQVAHLQPAATIRP